MLGKILAMRARSLLGPAFGLLAAGCAMILGFEDTTLRADATDAATDAPPEAAIEGSTGDGGDPRLDADPRALVLRRGSSAEVRVSIVRGEDVTGPVKATVSNLPAGVTATEATLADGETEGVVRLSAAPNAALGRASARLSVDAPALPSRSLELLVADGSGKPDVTFDSDGVAIFGARGTGSTFHALALQNDGKILAGGFAAAQSGGQSTGWILRRFQSDGTPDTAFDNAVSLPNNGELRAIAVAPGDKIVLVGTSAPTQVGVRQLTVVRLNANGATDASFAGGIVRLTIVDAPTGSSGLAVAIRPDGAVVAAGARQNVGDEAGIALRLAANGARDPAFNGGNVLAVPKNRFVGAAVEPTGSIVLAGTDETTALTSFYLTRRTADGGVDTTFAGADGLKFGLGFRANDFVRLPDGTLALAGDSSQTAGTYTAGAASGAGQQLWVRGFGTGAGAAFFGLAAQTDGRLVAAGHTTSANAEARVDRLLPDGGRDVSFGEAGTAFVERAGPGNAFDVRLFAAAVQADGRILVAGTRTNAGAVVYRLWP